MLRSLINAPVLPDPNDVSYCQHPQHHAGTAGSTNSAATAATPPATADASRAGGFTSPAE